MPRPDRHPRFAALALLCTLALAAGCQPRLMRPPVMFSDTAADPFAQLPAEARRTQATLFYATNRQAVPQGKGKTSKPLAYGTQRAGALTLGRIDTHIGEDLTWDQLEATSRDDGKRQRPELHLGDPDPYGLLLTTAPPRLVRRQTGENPEDLETRFIPRNDPGRAAFRFADQLNAEMDATGHHEIYVYVHGYFNDFTDSLETAASLHHYNGRRGAVVAFAWPSRKHLLDYFADRESAQYSASDLRQLLVFLSNHTQAQRIHLIAHSMGTFLTSSTLRELRLSALIARPKSCGPSFASARWCWWRRTSTWTCCRRSSSARASTKSPTT